MSFKSVYLAVYNQLKADTALGELVKADDFILGFKEALPARKYMVIFEPGQEKIINKRKAATKSASGVTGYIVETEYEIQHYCRLLYGSERGSSIIGDERNVGLLDFIEIVKAAIRKDMSFSCITYGRSTSEENAAGTFDLDASHRYLAVSIDGKTPNGYDLIDCGSSTLTGAQVAENIQTSIRALGLYSDDGYKLATCTFNSTTNQFVITSANFGPTSIVNVTVGASDDASSLLGFSSPVEVRGTNIITANIDPITAENKSWPVRYRILPLRVVEETYIEIGG